MIVFFQLVPKIAIAPLFVVWFGFGLFPKVLLTFLLCFFPTLVASMTGFRALDERVLYLTRSMGASAWQTFRYVRLPAALTYIFAGLKVSAVFAATGAIVGEFVGANAGLGYLLLRGTSYPRHAADLRRASSRSASSASCSAISSQVLEGCDALAAQGLTRCNVKDRIDHEHDQPITGGEDHEQTRCSSPPLPCSRSAPRTAVRAERGKPMKITLNFLAAGRSAGFMMPSSSASTRRPAST